LALIGDLHGVQYLYAERKPASVPPGVSLKPERVPLGRLLASAPASVLDGLREAALKARIGRIEALSVEVERCSPAAAQQILTLARDFRYDAIVTALDEAAAARTDGSGG
jgi:hypothetical protein